MPNPIFNMLQGMMPQQGNPMSAVMERFNAFRSSFSGNAQEQVMKMLQSGRVSQSAYNDAVNKANQIMKMMNQR